MPEPRAGNVNVADLPRCSAMDCFSLADWHYRDDRGHVYLCSLHGGTEPAEGWDWIGKREACGFCTNGVFFSSRRDAEGLPPEIKCPYCDGTGLVQ